MSAIATDAPVDFDPTGDSGVDDFLKRLVPTDADKPSGEEKKKDEPVTETGEENTETTETKEGEETPAEKPEGETADEDSAKTDEELKFAEDDSFVKVKVGDEELAVPVKDLQRLYGQEKALTQKSMEVAEQRKALEAKATEQGAVSAALLKRAQERWEPYSKIDFNLAAKELSAEEYTQLRQGAQAAWDDVNFLQNNVKGFMDQIQKQQHETLVEQAKTAIKVLSGPVDQGGIEGFNDKLYDDMRSYATKAGLTSDIINNLVDPAALRILHSAMLYDAGKSKVKTVKVNNTPKKIVKTTTAPAQSGADKSKSDAAKARLAKTGDVDDAANLFMSRWADRDAENT